MDQHVDVVVIGAGQAGLTLSYFLTRAGVEHLVLERNNHRGGAWHSRWDTMHMVTPNWMNSLPGLPFPGSDSDPDGFAHHSTTKQYLEDFARSFNAPVKLGVNVTRIERKGDQFVVRAGADTYTARDVVVASGAYPVPKVPPFASKLSADVVQVHSSEYRNPDQFPAGSTVLVVGSGSSGIPIAADIAGKHTCTIALGSNPQMPRKMPGKAMAGMLSKMPRPKVHFTPEEMDKIADTMWWLNRAGLWDEPVDSPWAQRGLNSSSEPYVGPPLDEIMAKTGLEKAERITDANGNTLTHADGSTIQPTAVVWATGYRSDYSWIDAPVFDEKGKPKHVRGVTDVPGLYFLGLRFLMSHRSSLLYGATRDAGYLAEQIEQRRKAA